MKLHERLAQRRARIAAVSAALVEPAAHGDPVVSNLCHLLARLPDPVPPAELHSPAFYEAILEHAARRSVTAIGAPVLRAAFAPQPAAADVAWVEPAESSLAPAVRTPGPVAPGWLWPRIRADLRRFRQPVTRRGWGLAAAAAAAILLMVLGLRHGTSSPPELVFQQVDRPLSAFGHPSDFLRDLGR